MWTSRPVNTFILSTLSESDKFQTMRLLEIFFSFRDFQEHSPREHYFPLWEMKNRTINWLSIITDRLANTLAEVEVGLSQELSCSNKKCSAWGFISCFVRPLDGCSLLIRSKNKSSNCWRHRSWRDLQSGGSGVPGSSFYLEGLSGESQPDNEDSTGYPAR